MVDDDNDNDNEQSRHICRAARGAWVNARPATESRSFHSLNRVTHTALDVLEGAGSV